MRIYYILALAMFGLSPLTGTFIAIKGELARGLPDQEHAESFMEERPFQSGGLVLFDGVGDAARDMGFEIRCNGKGFSWRTEGPVPIEPLHVVVEGIPFLGEFPGDAGHFSIIRGYLVPEPKGFPEFRINWDTGRLIGPDRRELPGVGLVELTFSFAGTMREGEKACQIELYREFVGGDLRLIPSLGNAATIPEEGKNLIIVAMVGKLLHFRIFDGFGNISVDIDELKILEQARSAPNNTEYNLRLLPALRDVNDIPREGKGLVVVASVGGVPHFRVFDPQGKLVLNENSERLSDLAEQFRDEELSSLIEALKDHLSQSGPACRLPKADRDRIVSTISSINSHIVRFAIEGLRDGLRVLWPPHRITELEKHEAVDTITAILRYSPFRLPPDSTFLVTITSERKDGQAICRDFMKKLELKMKLATKLNEAR